MPKQVTSPGDTNKDLYAKGLLVEVMGGVVNGMTAVSTPSPIPVKDRDQLTSDVGNNLSAENIKKMYDQKERLKKALPAYEAWLNKHYGTQTGKGGTKAQLP